jgi:hypothetical protein
MTTLILTLIPTRGSITRPFSCNIRFFGIGLEQTLEGYVRGGTGYMTLAAGEWLGFMVRIRGRVRIRVRVRL